MVGGMHMIRHKGKKQCYHGDHPIPLCVLIVVLWLIVIYAKGGSHCY
jgi:uncharacterized membrane protein YsdA (DUF1294 family)